MKWDARPLVLAALGALLTATSAWAQRAPVAFGQRLVTSVDTATAVTLKAENAGGDALTYRVDSGPYHGTYSGTPPDLTYHPEAGYSGRDSLTFKANDGSYDSNIATVKILVNDAPTGTVKINEGKETEAATRRTSVLLTLTVEDAPGPILMCISNNETCSLWMPFAEKKKWRLDRTDGIKTVNVWFRDKWRQKSSPVSDSIRLDRKAPTGGVVTAVPGDAKVTLEWDGFTDGAGSGIAGYRAVFKRGRGAPLSCNDGTPVPGYDGTAKTLEHTVLAGGTPLVNGTNYSYRVCAVDAVGNISSGATVTGKPVAKPPDTTAPSGTVTINGGAAATNSALATLTLTASDDGGGPIEICISNTATCGSWTAFEPTPSWTLAGGDGTATVNVWFRDQWGNASAAPSSDTIILDTTAPSGTVTINGGAAATNSTLAALTLTAADDGGGPIEICISNTATCGSWAAFEPTPSWTLAGGDGTATVNVWFRDQLGNESAAPSSDTIFLDTTAPSDGAVTAAMGVAQQLTVNWSGFADSPGSGVTGYRVVFQEGSAPASCDMGLPVPGYAGVATTLVHPGLIDGASYGYRVCAIDAAGNLSSGATACSVVNSCENCHGKNGYVHPGINDGAGDDAPNVMTYWDGSWWDSNQGGSNTEQQGGHGDPDHFAVRQCLDCHDITLPDPSTHLDGVYNSIWGDGSGTRNQNTAHLKASFIGGTSPAASVQLTLDAACWGCHGAVGGIVNHRHGDLEGDIVELGTHLSRSNGDTLPLPVPNDQAWPGPYPVDQDISTNASGSTYYAPCISCHDPHGTGAPAKTGSRSNRMLRSWSKEGILILCRVCHLQ